MIGGLHRCPCRYGLTPSTHKGTDLQQQTEALQPKLAASQHRMPHFQGPPFVGSKLGQHDGDIVGPGQINDLHHLCQALGTPQACSHMCLRLSGQYKADDQPEAAPALARATSTMLPDKGKITP